VDPERPLETLSRWLREARDDGLAEHDAIALATADAVGRPSARIVSLRRVEHDALVCTTALWTRKARELRENPYVALVIHWPSLGRQVQVAGRAEFAERALAEELFARRDRPHQLQALVSRQGEPIGDLTAMRARLDAVRAEVGDAPVPCPPDWGAVRVRAHAVEYWSASPDALHDRILFERDDAGWRSTRLAP
jgi:pyridoxamine 5'-phosphate oxidase